MSKVFGSNEALLVEETADSYGEIEISMAVMAIDAESESVSTWLNKDDAKKLIVHLTKAFDL